MVPLSITAVASMVFFISCSLNTGTATRAHWRLGWPSQKKWPARLAGEVLTGERECGRSARTAPIVTMRDSDRS